MPFSDEIRHQLVNVFELTIGVRVKAKKRVALVSVDNFASILDCADAEQQDLLVDKRRVRHKLRAIGPLDDEYVLDLLLTMGCLAYFLLLHFACHWQRLRRTTRATSAGLLG